VRALFTGGNLAEGERAAGASKRTDLEGSLAKCRLVARGSERAIAQEERTGEVGKSDSHDMRQP